MSQEYILACGSAAWLGLLCAISPCPLASNIAAVGFIGRRVRSVGRVLGAGLLYTLGRTVAYAALGGVLAGGLLAAPAISHTLEKYMTLLMGPLLVLVAMVLLNLLKLPVPRIGGAVMKRLENTGSGGAFLLGLVFAMSFCPTSAALFFGSLLPMAVKMRSGVMMPAIFGIATGLPVAVFAFMLAFGANRIGRAYDRLSAFEVWAQRITGAVFLAVGLYMTIAFTLKF
ncbi:MAG: aromatic aminobenezylarsenical efflux permease ArsG family transporter [Victivallaceae bacterium]|nr:aromatic aminobenezylarsenical efflux permease ArsG family transporter [Victivallaceae bacterium]